MNSENKSKKLGDSQKIVKSTQLPEYPYFAGIIENYRHGPHHKTNHKS